MEIESINKRMGRGIVWMIAARLTDRGIGIVSTLILARLLVPDDFGLVAMATAVGSMLDIIGAFSFDLALIQNSRAERRHYDTVWTFNVIFGAFCAIGMILLANVAARFYNDPRISGVMYALSLSFFIGGFTNVGTVNFRKDLNFSQEFVFIFVRRVVTFTVTISAAFMLRSYWALLIGMTVGRFVTFWMSYKMNSYRPRITLSAAKELFHFSKWLFINNALGFLRHDGCTFIVGRLFGAAGLGVYAVSYEISHLPTTELVAPINRVTFPGFSKMGNIKDIRDSYFLLLGVISLLIVPIGVGIAAVAEPLVLAALGEKWSSGVNLIAIMALSGAIMSTQTNNLSVWLALGKPHKNTIVQACYLIILFPALYFFLQRYGIVGAGYAYLTAQIVDVGIEMSTTKRLLTFAWIDVLRVVWRPVVGCIVMYFVVSYLDSAVKSHSAWFRLLIEVACGALTYGAIIVFLWICSAKPVGSETFFLIKARILR